MRSLLILMTLGAGLLMIGGGRPRRLRPILLPAPDDQPGEPESWLAGEAEAFRERGPQAASLNGG